MSYDDWRKLVRKEYAITKYIKYCAFGYMFLGNFMDIATRQFCFLTFFLPQTSYLNIFNVSHERIMKYVM